MTRLTKTKYVESLACDRHLWLATHQPELATPPDAAAQRLFRQGQDVDRAARERFPGGILIPTDYRRPQEALEATRTAIASGQERLFQAAFEHEGVFIVADVLERLDEGWHLIEVKMAGKVKPEHLDDVAIQKHVLEAAGISVHRITLMHVNTDHLHPDGDDLFTLEDVTDRVGEASDVNATLERYQRVLAEPEQPEAPLGRHCLRPETCAFKAHCWHGLEGQTIYDLQDLHHKTQAKLEQEGVLLINDIPPSFPLPSRAQAGLERYHQGHVEIHHETLDDLLGELEYPLAFLDFETDSSPLPIYDGTRPYEQIPFQYSLHVLEGNPGGPLAHADYLHTEPSDPRPDLVAALLRDMPATGSVIAYNASFEKRVLKALAEAFPEHADELLDVAERMWDQLDVVRKAYRHPDFGASNSIKAVLPVLVPNLTYKGLDVGDGAQAQVAFGQIVQREAGWEQRIDDLRAYCRLDTLAMVELHKHFTTLAGGPA